MSQFFSIVIPAKAGIRRHITAAGRMTRRIPAFAGMTACALLLNACSSLLTATEPPPAIYVMHPKLDTGKTDSYSGVLQVTPPAVPGGFDTDRIALYWNNGRRLDYYSGAKWPERLDDLLQDFVVRSARSAYPGLTVAAPDLDLPSRYRLAVKVLEFQPTYAGPPSGIPDLYGALQFTLVSLPDEKPVADFTVADHKQAASDDLGTIASGLESLLQSLLSQGFERLGPVIRQDDKAEIVTEKQE
jgi:ABC-type uncharacterized transport system auxiliary subunit